MLKDIFETVKQFFDSHRKETPTRLEFLDKKRTRVFWNPETRKVEREDFPRPDANHKFLTIASLIDYIEGRNHGTNVWVGRKVITVELIENEPGDILTLDLATTSLFQKLEGLVTRPSIFATGKRRRCCGFDSRPGCWLNQSGFERHEKQ